MTLPAPTHSTRRHPLRARIARAFGAASAAAALTATLTGAAQPDMPSDESGVDSGRSTTGEEVVWSLTPTSGSDGEDAGGDRVSFRFEVDPGQSVEDAVELTNHTNREITYDLTASDGVVGSTGAFDMLPPSVESERTGTWIELVEDSVTVPAGESVEVPFTLTVPESATPGDHPGGIAASVSPEDAAGDQVSTVARVGARVHLRVAGEIKPVIGLTDLQLDYEQNWNPFAPGTLTARWTTENPGNVRLGSAQDLTVGGPFGWFAQTEPATEIRELLPGQVVELEMSTEAWPLFVDGAEVISTPSVVGEDEVEAELERTAVTGTTMALPIPQLILLALLVLLVWWLATRRRRRKAAFAAAVEKAAQKKATQQPAADTPTDEGDQTDQALEGSSEQASEPPRESVS
ncbi:WxL protein peptidoglycan domain-containing protein [Citricoccus parietis]|uniref:WxL protein peptidoglycan domain-containing protein n=1 Tax=Citricoccus parietis TaxID=592307 RepID=A0ABV6F981_9MICC